jgi:hypothetical protein
MNKYYFTFGHGQPLFPGCVEVIAADKESALDLMFSKYKSNFCAMYNDYSKIHPNDSKIVDRIKECNNESL